MTEEVKTCKKHGELQQKDIWIRSDNPHLFKCKICNNERSRNYVNKNREKINEYKQKWRAKRKNEGYIKPKPRKERKIYDPNDDGDIWQCNIHGWLKKENLYFRKIKEKYYQPSCKECVKQKTTKDYYDNRDIRLQKHREYEKENADIIKLKSKIYRDKNKDLIYQRLKERIRKNPEHFKRLAKLNRIKNAEKIKIINKAYVSENREKVRETTKNYYERNKERLLLKRKEWINRTRKIRNEKARQYTKKAVDELRDSYIRLILKTYQKGDKKGKEYIYLKEIEIPQELIDIKRNLIKLKRKLKEKRKCQKPQA